MKVENRNTLIGIGIALVIIGITYWAVLRS